MTLTFPRVRRAHDLPELRAWLVHQWREGTTLARVVSDAQWIQRDLPSAELWWVEEETCHLLADSAPTLPADLTLDMHDMPAAAGFAVFAHDLEGIDSDPEEANLDGMVRVSAIMWGPVHVPLGSGREVVPALGIGTWSRSVLEDGLSGDELRRAGPTLFALTEERDRHMMRPDGRGNFSAMLHGDVYCYLGRSDWLPGCGPDEINDGDPYAKSEVAQRSKAEDRRLLACLWQLAKTPIVSMEVQHPPRAAARRAQRAGYDPTVRVLTLGRRQYEPSAEPVKHSVDWQHSWIVRPHWRWQAHGQGRKERKLILVGPYRKGPADKPLLGAERVWRVVPPKGG